MGNLETRNPGATGISTASIYTDFQGLAGLRRAARERSPEALRETARQFEGLFIQMIVKAMRESLPKDGLFDSEQVRFFQGMFDQQISLDLAQRGGLGLAEVLYRQLGGEPGGSRRLHPLAAPYSPRAGSTPGGPEAPTSTAPAGYAESPEAFVSELWPHAVRAGRALGVAADVLIAQSALETGWGRKVIRDRDGNPGHNVFGIKADGAWQGRKTIVSTLEYQDGVAVRRQAAFRAYDSVAQGFEDYVAFISSNPRYQQALALSAQPRAYLKALQDAGYATDPAYADKILSIMSGGSFLSRIGPLKDSQAPPTI
jgi:flagellar protein FlgJ